MYKSFFKPSLDFFFSFVLFIFFLPLFISICFLLLFLNRGEIFFLQNRPGLNCNMFRIIKFKTMADVFDENGNLLPDKLRIKGWGRILRILSLDEIPQLLNVLKGDMSFIGPRPLREEYLERYSPFQIRRHEVKPGITGLAQVYGRNKISWNQKFKLDVYYVDNHSFLLDFKILIKTIKTLFLFKQVNSSDSTPMDEFHGNS